MKPRPGQPQDVPLLAARKRAEDELKSLLGGPPMTDRPAREPLSDVELEELIPDQEERELVYATITAARSQGYADAERDVEWWFREQGEDIYADMIHAGAHRKETPDLADCTACEVEGVAMSDYGREHTCDKETPDAE